MKLKTALNRNKLTIGSWITMPSTGIAEILCRSGLDWLTIDLEHSVISLGEAEQLIRVIDLSGVAPLIRLTSHDANQIKRVLDSGAHGLIVPNVKNAAEVDEIKRAAYYPPAGERGVGLARAQGYGDNFGGHWKWLESNLVIIVQIENVEAVNNIRDILAHDTVDGLIIGPFDLSASMGIPGEFQHPDFLSALSKIKATADELNKPMGIHIIEPDQEQLRQRIASGYRFIAYSLDFEMIRVGVNGAIAVKNSI